ncbi:hypothetical protein SAMN05216188_116153 [Lentzea xinjiangensis]|uniref:Uncharacterized protein n=1 Tax=Lentzea xinjiangensis TaxID=402600 RepID=A0A1H9SMB9_9PSEU|nr:hypothetical protein [Lentzea xinjiangensis]SER86028.1 hypothetical protein SAMN05216188_116153 [Lentzea xinjiangensis]
MRDVLDDDLAELYPVRPADDPRLGRLRERLFAEEPPPRSRRWAGVAAAAAAVVMITGLVAALRPAARDAPATMPTAPATSLQEAATLLELAPKPVAKYRHVTYTIWQTMSFGGIEGGPFSATALEFRIDAWVPTANGEMVVIYRRFTGNHRAVTGVQQNLDRIVPNDYNGPQLWGTFCTATPCRETSLALPLPVTPSRKLEGASSRLLSPYTTNEEKAATYRELAASPEVRWDNGTVTVDGGLTSFRIDPATGEVVGSAEAPPATSPLPPGVPLLAVSVSSEWTDQRPS